MSNLVALPGGTELAGDFRIKRVLGAGGFGITYLADELALARQVTIKEYFPTDYAARKNGLAAFPRSQESAADYKWGLDRFIEEAQTLARFDHPNIVRVYRYFRANNTGYMVLQFEEGGSFKTWLRGLGRAPRQTELDALLGPLLDALELIHKGDFLHRDIAPDNIIVRKDKSPVLIDFGSARGEIASQSRTVSALVKPGYSPYEQYASNTRQQGPWTDIYALGATFYQAISGKRPPDAPSRMVRDEYVSAREAAIGSYRAGFLAAIDKALKLEVTERPQSIADWRGPLLAPDPKPAAAKPARARIGEVLGLKRVGEPEPRGPELTSISPPPPDIPKAPGQPAGQLLDYVDGLRKAPPDGARPDAGPGIAAVGAAVASAGAPAIASPVMNAAEPAQRFGLGYGGAPVAAAPRPAPAAEAPVPPKAAPAKPVRVQTRGIAAPLPAPPLVTPPITPLMASVTPAALSSSADATPQATPKAAVERRRPRRRREAWAIFRNPWRGLLLKLTAGIAVASVLTIYQERWPLSGLAALGPPAVPHGSRASAPRPVPLLPRGDSAATKPEPPQSEQAATTSRSTPPLSPTSTSAPSATPQLQLASQQLAGPTGQVTAVHFLGESRRVVTVSTDATLRLWDADSGALVRQIALPEGPATALAAQEGRALTGHTDGSMVLWDLAKGERLAVFKRNPLALTAVAFAPETDHFISASSDATLVVWNRATPAVPVQVSEIVGGSVTSLVRVSARDAVAYAVADKTVHLTNSEALSQIRNYHGHTAVVTALDSPGDGRALASAASDGQIRVWSTASSRLIKSFQAHSGAVTGLSFAASGAILASVGADGMVKMWDAKRGRLLASAQESVPGVHAIAVTADGRRLATAETNGTVRLWDAGTVKIARQ